jgi:hypothetical protein
MIADAVQRLSSGRNLRFSILLAIFAGALALRLLAVFESLDNPSFFFPIVDAGAYDAIARELAANGNISPRLFWQPFLYPVFLAATYLISGGSILAAKVLQAIIGSLTCSLVFILGNRQLGKNVGLAAATITALYGPVILFEGELLAAGLAAFFAVLLVLLFTIVADRSRPLLVVTLGIVRWTEPPHTTNDRAVSCCDLPRPPSSRRPAPGMEARTRERRTRPFGIPARRHSGRASFPERYRRPGSSPVLGRSQRLHRQQSIDVRDPDDQTR